MEEKDTKRLLQAFPQAELLETHILRFRGEEALLFTVLKEISEQRMGVRRIEREETSLETVFLEVAKG